MSGFATWARQYLVTDGRVWIGGYTVQNWLEVEGGALTIASADGLRLLRTHAGTSIVQSFYRGEDAPNLADWKTFTTGFLADDETDFFTFERLRSLGRPVQFFIGDWAADTFQAQAGKVYKLLRSPGNGIVPGMEDEDFPIRIDLEGVETPDAATIVGRAVTASADGELTITYAPIYQVLLQQVGRNVTEMNNLVVSVTMTEVISS